MPGSARSDPNMLYNHIVGFDTDSAIDKSDTRRRGRLAGNGKIRFCYGKYASFKVNDTAYFKYNDPFSGGLRCFIKGSWSVGIEIGNPDDVSAVTTWSVSCPSLCAGEGKLLSFEGKSSQTAYTSEAKTPASDIHGFTEFPDSCFAF